MTKRKLTEDLSDLVRHSTGVCEEGVPEGPHAHQDDSGGLYQGGATKEPFSPPLGRRLDDARLVVRGLVDPAAHRIRLHLVREVRPEIHKGFLVGEAGANHTP